MYNQTFQKSTIHSVFKRTELILYNPEVLFKKSAHFLVQLGQFPRLYLTLSTKWVQFVLPLLNIYMKSKIQLLYWLIAWKQISPKCIQNFNSTWIGSFVILLQITFDFLLRNAIWRSYIVRPLRVRRKKNWRAELLRSEGLLRFEMCMQRLQK